MPREATTHIPLTPEVRDAIRDFARGMGTDYSTAVRRLLHEVALTNEQPIETGLRMRGKQDTASAPTLPLPRRVPDG